MRMQRAPFCLSTVRAALLCLGALLGTACQSGSGHPDLPGLEPLSLLGGDSSIYVSVPVAAHAELAAHLLQAELPPLSSKDADLLVSHLDMLYAGLGTVDNLGRLELAASGNFPPVAIKSLLTAKNGWSRETFHAGSSPEALAAGYPATFDTFVSEEAGFAVSFPSPGVLCAAPDVRPLLEHAALRSPAPEKPYAGWVGQDSEDILFYIARPGQYLRNLIGLTVNGCDAVYGQMAKRAAGQYELAFAAHITAARAVPAFVAALELSLGMMGCSIRQLDNQTIQISGIPVGEQQLIDLFTRDPITGKHFRVSGNTIITE